MGLIRIQERKENTNTPNTPNAVLIFENGVEYPINITNPFAEEDEKLLEWYFEEHLHFPFTRNVDAQNAAKSVFTYGETLFQQVFADQNAYATYKQYIQAGLHTLQVEVAGSPQFHSLHWEALKDPALPAPLSLQATMIRKNLVPQVIPATLRPSATINVLVVTARPSGSRDVGYRTISRPLVEELHQAQLRVQVEILRPGTYQALDNHLREVTVKQGVGYYHVIHFDVHGALLNYDDFQQEGKEVSRVLYQQRYGRADIAQYEGTKAFLFLESERNEQADPVEATELANLLMQHQIPIVILNACQSGKQVGASETSLGSRLMQAGVQMVLAMGYSVTVSAAEILMRTLYKQLFAHKEFSTALCTARQELYNRKERRAYYNQRIDLEDWLLPVAYQNQVQQLSVRQMTIEESNALRNQQVAIRYTPAAQPSYGFVGRDLDILQIEKLLLMRRNILLIRGMGGAGKTTLLHHLGSWWQTTGFVAQVFYFGYDERGWTRQQIMNTIAKKLMSRIEYLTTFQPLSLDAQQDVLAQRLRAERHLLILDNMESITGARLAIQHPLSKKEQNALHSLLAALVGGQTIVLLGSRGSEEWLAKDTFIENIHDLGGLDPEAASQFTDLILTRHNVTKYRQNEDLRRLLKLLAGFPLALEVVLANLVKQTPAEILAALKAGNVTLDGDSQQKTESIIRCIDYSHSNLSPAAQNLLICLAPFTSVFDTNVLKAYTKRLQQQPNLASLPFERWSEILHEAENWGLLTPDPDNSSYLHLQPVFPYFLQTRLALPEQAKLRASIELAFRQLYEQYADELDDMLIAKEARQRQIGLYIVSLEYENLITALQLALNAHTEMVTLHLILQRYLDAAQDRERMLELNRIVLDGLEKYPASVWSGNDALNLFSVMGNVAEMQRQLKQYAAAGESYQKLLTFANQATSIDEKVLGLFKATTYHGLGMVAQQQRQWQQAERYYQQTLQIYEEYQARYEQARTYHQLGMVAQEQRQWSQAEQYFQQALQIYEEFRARYEQAGTYHNLGIVAQEQGQWQQACDYFLKGLEIYAAYEDRYYTDFPLRQLAKLWQERGDTEILAKVADIMKVSQDEVEAMFRGRLESESCEIKG